MTSRTILTSLLVLATGLRALGQDLSAVSLPDALTRLLQTAHTVNPRVQAEDARVASERHRAASLDGFYDPRLEAAAGWLNGPVAVPGTLLPTPPDDALAAQGSLTVPLDPGARLITSLTRWDSLAGGSNTATRSVAALTVEVPLLRDRGFLMQTLRTEAAASRVRAADAECAAVWRDTCYHVIRAYADWLRARGELDEASSATSRVMRLLAETEERVRLQVTPAYQVHAARMEVAFRAEEVCQAEAGLVDARVRLEEAVGAPLPADLTAAPNALCAWAAACATTGVAFARARDGGMNRPELRAAAERATEADTLTRLAREDGHDDVTFQASVGWTVDDSDTDGQTRTASGWQAAVIWRRPLGFRAETATLAARAADAEAARHDLQALRIAIDAEIARARAAWQAGCERLTLVDIAVKEARNALDAEEDRFRLGDGRSRNVLDSQKDLTAAARRVYAAAAETVRAYADLVRATGAPFTPEPRTE
jgi:outer membrane protein TolC